MANDSFYPSASADTPVRKAAEVSIDDIEVTGFTQQTLGGVFDSAFDLYKRHFATLALIVACVFIPTQVILHAASNIWLRPLMAQVSGATPDPFVVIQVGVIAFFTGAPQFGLPGYLSLLTCFMVSGPVAVAVANILVGRPLTVSGAYKRAVPVLWRLFSIWNFLFVIFVVAFFMVLIGLSLALALVIKLLSLVKIAVSAITGPEFSFVLGLLMIVFPYLSSCALATMLFAFAPPLIGLENLTVLGAVERNSRLIQRKHFWRVCLTVTLLPIVTFGLQILILASASSLVTVLKCPAWAEFVVNTGLSSLIGFFFQPYWMIFITLLYFDTRVRTEGLDVRYLADNLPELDPLLGTPSSASEGKRADVQGFAPPPQSVSGAPFPLTGPDGRRP